MLMQSLPEMYVPALHRQASSFLTLVISMRDVLTKIAGIFVGVGRPYPVSLSVEDSPSRQPSKLQASTVVVVAIK